jgi:transposase InsO family protein
MVWQVSTVVDRRRELVTSVLADQETVTSASRRLGVSRETAYKWLRRMQAEGDRGLSDRSRRPVRSPAKTAVEVEQAVCDLRRTHPAWGGRKLHHRLRALDLENVPCPSTITDILRRNDLLSPERRLKRDWQRFEAEEPNQMWQMDFKGDFALPDGRCYPLTVLDDHSRFNLCLQASPNQRRETVQSQLLPVFMTYGLPEAILVDNGPPWGSGYSRQPHTRFTAWLMQLGIYVAHGRPYHPQTRGKEERFHRSLKAEVLAGRDWLSLPDVQAALDPWRQVYNHERPHQALAFAVPASRYVPSPRSLPGKLPTPDYEAGDEIRRVQQQGEVYFGGRTYQVSRAFIGQPVALRATEEDGVWAVHYYKQRVGTVDLKASRSGDL